jgi:hypothetical protein
MNCDCWPLLARSGHASNLGITYRVEYGYGNNIGCPWSGNAGYSFTSTRTTLTHSTTVSIPMHLPAPEPLDTTWYDRQTMFVVPHDLRNVTHTNHVCVISTSYVHANHNGFCKHGPHCMWEAFCALNPYTSNFRRCEIQKWLVDRQINCMRRRHISRENAVS